MDGSTREVALVEWAADRFSAAKLQLPSINLTFSADSTRCGGLTAIIVHGTEPKQIVVCGTDEQTRDVVLMRIILHELAHAWAHESLDQETRSALMVDATLDEWSTGARSGRGSEYAAEIVMWGLMDRDLPLFTLNRPERSQLERWFKLLTNQTPLGRSR